MIKFYFAGSRGMEPFFFFYQNLPLQRERHSIMFYWGTEPFFYYIFDFLGDVSMALPSWHNGVHSKLDELLTSGWISQCHSEKSCSNTQESEASKGGWKMWWFPTRKKWKATHSNTTQTPFILQQNAAFVEFPWKAVWQCWHNWSRVMWAFHSNYLLKVRPSRSLENPGLIWKILFLHPGCSSWEV